jgi:carbon-monoxide dehydrogenase small subunit
MGPLEVTFTINGDQRTEMVQPRLLLSDFLRHHLHLTGTHVGCEHGVCGSCTILVDGAAVRSCLMFAVQVEGRSITTVEGLAIAGELNLLQQAFREHHALQCGYCTPGFLMSAVAWLRDLPDAAQVSDEEIRDAFSGNLCRCTGYQNIIRALRAAATAGVR